MKIFKDNFSLNGYNPRVPLKDNLVEIKKVLKWAVPVIVGWGFAQLADFGVVADVTIIALVSSLMKAYTIDLLDFWVGDKVDIPHLNVQSLGKEDLEDILKTLEKVEEMERNNDASWQDTPKR